MCFNALISNNDDHPRNHAVLAWEKDWGLSPAYDLTPSVPVSAERRDLAMSAGDFGRWANAQNLLSQAPRFLLSRTEAQGILETMRSQVRSTWHSVARSRGVTEGDCAVIARAFVYPRFDLGQDTEMER